MKDRDKTKEQLIDELVKMRQRIAESTVSEAQCRQAEKQIHQQNEFSENILESIAQPFYVIDATDYTIKLANSATIAFGSLEENTTCYALTHNRREPCVDTEHPCPLEEVKRTKKPAIAEHVHYDSDGNALYFEIRAYPVFDNEGNVVRMIEHSLDVTERRRSEQALQKLARDVRQRVKELDCLYGISNLVEQQGVSLREIFQGTVGLVSSAWQYPEITCARIILEEQEFRTDSFTETIWKQASDIIVHGERAGAVEVCYLEEKPESDEGPFLKEERSLIDAIAQRLGRIAERKWAEEALQENEEKYRTLFETMAQGVVYQAADGEIIHANPAAERILGLTLDQMQGRTSMDPRWKATRENGSAFYGETHPSMVALKSGKEVRDVVMGVLNPLYDEYRWININAVPQYKPGESTPYQVYTTFDDITELKRAEEALRRSNRELALLNRVGQELTALLDLQQIIEQSLQAAAETIGAEGASAWLWDEEQEDYLVCRAALPSAQGRSLINLRLHSSQGITGWVAQEGESVIATSTPDDPRFFPGVDEQTSFRTVSLIAVPLRVRGAIVGVMEAANKQHGEFDTNDIALLETLAAYTAISIDNARLVEALRQHTVELESRNEELDAFAHTVAHDLKGPLGPIVGFAQALEEDCATLPGEDLRSYLHTIARNGRKMSSIIDELLLLARVRKSVPKTEVPFEPLDMAAVVVEALQRLAYVIEEHQAEIVLPDTWPAALGYGPWVEEVWVNYLSNGIKYGGQPPCVELGATTQPDGAVRFWVRDNGPGLTPEEQARLFTPFTRLDQVRAKGHGLGLSIVRRVVERLGGETGVESEVGKGSVFTFTLPGVASVER